MWPIPNPKFSDIDGRARQLDGLQLPLLDVVEEPGFESVRVDRKYKGDKVEGDQDIDGVVFPRGDYEKVHGDEAQPPEDAGTDGFDVLCKDEDGGGGVKGVAAEDEITAAHGSGKLEEDFHELFGWVVVLGSGVTMEGRRW